jgi:hypothetical protein
MGWIDDHFHSLKTPPSSDAEETRFESREQDTWKQLVSGLKQDVDDFNRNGGSASFQASGDDSCRVICASANTALSLTADSQAHVIRYEYQPEGKEVAVPEGGILSLRAGDRGVEIYSADQRLSPEQARRMVLEPMFFPQIAVEDLEETGG